MDDYIDLTDAGTNLEDYQIVPRGFDCVLQDDEGIPYKGFLIARSEHGKAYTICNVSFHESATDSKYQPRITFRRTNETLQDKKVKNDQEFATVAINSGKNGYREFWRMIAFLSQFKSIVDVGDDFDLVKVVTKGNVVRMLKNLEKEEQLQAISDYVEEAGLTDHEVTEVLHTRVRKADVEEFEKLLRNTDDYVSSYREQHSIQRKGDEAVWHHFLKDRKWIFGLSLTLRFIEDFADEQAVGLPDTEGRGDPRVDLLGYSDYTILIELKTPKTKIFTLEKTSDARANTWSFTPEFIEGFSQCLAQKSDKTKSADIRTLVKNRKRLDRGVIRTIDPQVIYIVGDKESEMPRESKNTDIDTKRDTLERFIRNNRNVNIISYDELYRRAYYIAHNKPVDYLLKDIEPETSKEIDLSELPF